MAEKTKGSSTSRPSGSVNVAGRKVSSTKIQKVRARSISVSDGSKDADDAEFLAFDPVRMQRAHSDQIPEEIIQKTRKDTVPLPMGERMFDDLSALLLESTDFAVVVDQITTDTVGMPWRIHPLNESPDKEQKKRAMAFLENPHPEQTLTEILSCANSDFESLGNSWIELVRRDNDPKKEPARLIHAPGRTMRIHKDLDGYVQLARVHEKIARFRKLFSPPDASSSKYPQDDARRGRVMHEMIYLRQYHVASPWYGMPRVTPAIPAIRGNQYAADRNLSFFLNKAMPEQAIIIGGQTDNIPVEDLDEFRENVEAHFENLLRGAFHKILYLEIPSGIEVSFERLSGEIVKDADFRQYRIDNRDEVLRAHHMMPNRVGIIEAGNIGAGTGESQIEIYKNSVVRPKKKRWERVVNAILNADRPFGLGITDWEFRFDEIDTIDEAREATIAQILSSVALMTINEGREYVSKTMSRIELNKIDEKWADLPLPVLLPSIAGSGIADIPEEVVDSIRETTGIAPISGSPFNSFLTPGLNQLAGHALRSDDVLKNLAKELAASVVERMREEANGEVHAATAEKQEERVGG